MKKGLKDQCKMYGTCGIPFCHSGCLWEFNPTDFNDAVSLGNGGKGRKRIHSTNNFPEFTEIYAGNLVKRLVF